MIQLRKLGTLLSCLLGFITIALPSAAAITTFDTQQPERPKIGVVLAGGGAKGAAHIGVLKKLEEMKIPVDYITGTSMGAYVGGLYATGMSADEIEVLFETVDWQEGYVDKISRSERQVRTKEYEDYFNLNPDIGIGPEGLRSPVGVVQGQTMMSIVRMTSGNIPQMKSFDDFPIPYRAIATDIENFEEIVLEDGWLADAMMASMSVPGALPPYELDGMLLIDGGVTNNMPVNVAQTMGADIIIAVDISSNYLEKDQISNVLDVASQLSNYLVRRTTEEQKELLDEDKDILLIPHVGDIGTTDFHKMPQALQWGYNAATSIETSLSRYSLSSADYQRYIDEKQKKKVLHSDEMVVNKLVLNNNSHYRDDMLLDYLGIDPRVLDGETKFSVTPSSEHIEERVKRLYALDRFENIYYKFETGSDENGEEENTLYINVDEKSWGPNYLNFRFIVEEDFDSDSNVALGVSTNFTGLNDYGGELKANVELGTERRASLNYSSPFYLSQKWFNSLGVSYIKEDRYTQENYLDGEVDLGMHESSNKSDIEEVEFEGAIGIQPTLWQEARVGLRYISGSLTPSIGSIDYKRKGVFGRYRIDTLDDYSMPRHGVLLNVEYFASDDSLAGSASFDAIDYDFTDEVVHEFDVSLRGAESFGPTTLVGNVEFGTVESKSSENAPIQPKELGGFLRLSGIPRDSLIGQNLFFSSLMVRHRLFDDVGGLPVYVGASLEYGGVWNDVDTSISDAPLYHAGSLFTGVDSSIGPVVLAVGATEQGYRSVYFIIGKTF
ncbi:patatin-like phospholipase family protein [Vibrio hannami]|uniref:patatin-like phospholipase family protein n=1 Tax=Vibrio hannami TaxID=2717094 RepID=UPI00240F41A8|nr:patatin-like phospholipase family protein [Vibrio hannami]MDG3085391.1 patatin-like phospholipase family protein [Vibrio hannami]